MNALRSTLFLLLFVGSLPGSAAEKTPTQANLTELLKQTHTLSAEINVDRKKHSAIQAELRDQELAIVQLNEKLSTLDKKIAAQETQLREQEQQAIILDAQIKKRQTQLAQNLRALHATGQLPDFKLLFNQQDLSEWQRLTTYYRYFNQALQTEIQTLNNQLSVQEQLRDTIGANKNILALEHATFAEKKQQLTTQKNARQQLLNKLEKTLASKDAQLQELNASQQELRRLLAAIKQPHFAQHFPPVNAGNLADYQGKLAWPTVGKVQQTFGSQRKGGQRRYNGIVLSAPEGQPVQAVFSGRVVYADWLRGYGLLLILDHGKGYASLYAHNDALYKKVGDAVQAGESIGTVGVTGGLRAPALYFEIRQHSKPVNPQKWLTPKTRVKVTE